jgi:hypothetical protein
MAAMHQNANFISQDMLSQAHQLLKHHGMAVPLGTPPEHVVQLARQVMNNKQPNPTLMAYNRNLAAQQSQQGLTNRAPPNPQVQIPFQNSAMPLPMNGQANDPPTADQLNALNERAKLLGGTLSHPSSGGSHSLADYQKQLMVLELQNKKRLQHARLDTRTDRLEPNGRDEPPTGPQFPSAQGGGLQRGTTPLTGTSMSPSNSRTGPSPQISNLELQGQQRKPGQKTGSGAPTPEADAQMPGPSPAFMGSQGGMTSDLAQLAQMGGQAYQHQLMGTANGPPVQFVGGRPSPGMQFSQGQPVNAEMMKRLQQAGQFAQNWPPQQAFNPQMNHVIQPFFFHALTLGFETAAGDGPWSTSYSTKSTRQCRRTNASTTTASTTRSCRSCCSSKRIPFHAKRTTSNPQSRQQTRSHKSESNPGTAETKQGQSKRCPCYSQRA